MAKEITDLTSIIILNYNGSGVVEHCIDSIINNTDSPYELILIDNFSTDSSRNYVENVEQTVIKSKLCRRIKTVLLDKNVGYGAGNNAGMEVATGKYICIMNNDIIVPEGWLTSLIRNKEVAKADVVGPVCNYSGGYQMLPAEKDDKRDFPDVDEYFTYVKKYMNYSEPYFEVDTLMGWCMLFDRSIFIEYGGFDPRFGLGTWEDNDFCTRLYGIGKKLIVARNVILFHHGNVAFKSSNVNMQGLLYKNRQIYLDKWAPLYVSNKSPNTNLKVCAGLNWFYRLTGSEMYILTLAQYLRKLNIDMTISAPQVGGDIANMAAELGIRVSNPFDIQDFDIIQLSQNSAMKMFGDTVRILNKPTVLLVHGLVPNEVPTAEMISHADAIVGVSQEVYVWLNTSINVNASKLYVIMNPIDFKNRFFSNYSITYSDIPWLSDHLRSDSKKIILSSRIDSDKMGIIYSTLNMLNLLGTKVDVILCGDGSIETLIPNIELLKHNTSGDCRIIPVGPILGIEDLYRIADVHVGVGRTALEAAGVHTPVIISSTYGYDGILNRDTIAKLSARNYSGRLNNVAYDPQTMANDIMSVWDTKCDCGQFLYETHDADNVAQRFATLYQDVLMNRRLGSATKELISIE